MKALKKLQIETTKLEAEFAKELYALEAKYHAKNLKFFEKRAEITEGLHEPSDGECEYKSDEEEEVRKS